jgi:hypothetical protein
MSDRSLFPGLIISLRLLADIAREAAKSAHTRLPAAHSHRSSAASLADLRHRFRAWSRLVAEKRTGPSFTSNFAALSMSPVSGAKMSPSSQVSKARDAAKSEARELSSVGVLSADRAPARPPRRPSCSKVGPRIGTSVKALDGRSSPLRRRGGPSALLPLTNDT